MKKLKIKLIDHIRDEINFSLREYRYKDLVTPDHVEEIAYALLKDLQRNKHKIIHELINLEKATLQHRIHMDTKQAEEGQPYEIASEAAQTAHTALYS